MKFIDPAGLYTGPYTSEVYQPNTSGNNQKGVFQCDITTGTVALEGKADSAAPWATVTTYSASTIAEVVLTPYMRVTASLASSSYVDDTN